MPICYKMSELIEKFSEMSINENSSCKPEPMVIDNESPSTPERIEIDDESLSTPEPMDTDEMPLPKEVFKRKLQITGSDEFSDGEPPRKRIRALTDLFESVLLIGLQLQLIIERIQKYSYRKNIHTYCSFFQVSPEKKRQHLGIDLKIIDDSNESDYYRVNYFMSIECRFK